MSLTKEQRLRMQGYSCTPGSGINKVEKWIKFTPMLNALWILMGTILASPMLLWLFAIVSALGFANNRHLFDRLYNSIVRYFTKTEPVPVNPQPRRFAMLLAAIWSGMTGLLFFLGLTMIGYIFGFLLTGAAVLVGTTHFCLGSLFYRMWERSKVRIA